MSEVTLYGMVEKSGWASCTTNGAKGARGVDLPSQPHDREERLGPRCPGAGAGVRKYKSDFTDFLDLGSLRLNPWVLLFYVKRESPCCCFTSTPRSFRRSPACGTIRPASLWLLHRSQKCLARLHQGGAVRRPARAGGAI